MAAFQAFETSDPGRRWRRRFWWLLVLVVAVPLIGAVYAIARFLPNEPVDYPTADEHFKYGSTGGEQEMGFPYWIWQALPQVCAEFLPGKGYASLGLIYEQGKDLPIGVSKRRHLGIDRVFLNCASCHTSTVRKSAQARPDVVLGMPAHTFDILAFEKFFFDCGVSGKFTKEYLIPEIERASGRKLSLIDKYTVYPLAIWIMRERLLALRSRFEWALTQHPWGPGRVDTFNNAKVLFNFPMHKLPAAEMNAPADFPSIWNQGPREGMNLHWDGNNTKVEERNKSAAFGTGTTPPTIDVGRIAIVEKWLRDTAKPPAFKEYFSVDEVKAAKGKPLYEEYCAGCHGKSGQDFVPAGGIPKPQCLRPGESDEASYGPQVGKITRIDDIATDPQRLNSYTFDLAINQSTLYAGYPWRFCHFRKTFGYANMPLDGLWLRAPYLHNGSVPTLRDLLEPNANRPASFYRGNDVYDPVKVGFVSDRPEENGRKLFKLDTGVVGNGNKGHEGKAYGTELVPEEKDALVEYLKLF